MEDTGRLSTFVPGPDVAIWPFGHGVLVTAIGISSKVPMLVICAVPDGHTRRAGGREFDPFAEQARKVAD